MPRIRTIKPEFWDDELVGAMPPIARLVFVGCISHADDEGRMRGSAAFVRSQVFAYDHDTTLGDVEEALQLLHATRRIRLYGSAQRYLEVLNFRRHQRIQRPQKSALPAPGKGNPTAPMETVDTQDIPIPLRDASDTAPRPVTDGVEREGEWNGMEEEPTSTSAAPKRDLRSESREVFDHWCSVMEKRSNTIFSKDRQAKVLARLREGYTVSQLKEAVTGYTHIPFNMGDNPERRRWDDLELICRSGSNVEKGIEAGVSAANMDASGLTPEQAGVLASLPTMGGAA